MKNLKIFNLVGNVEGTSSLIVFKSMKKFAKKVKWLRKQRLLSNNKRRSCNRLKKWKDQSILTGGMPMKSSKKQWNMLKKLMLLKNLVEIWGNYNLLQDQTTQIMYNVLIVWGNIINKWLKGIFRNVKILLINLSLYQECKCKVEWILRYKANLRYKTKDMRWKVNIPMIKIK